MTRTYEQPVVVHGFQLSGFGTVLLTGLESYMITRKNERLSVRPFKKTSALWGILFDDIQKLLRWGQKNVSSLLVNHANFRCELG